MRSRQHERARGDSLLDREHRLSDRRVWEILKVLPPSQFQQSFFNLIDRL